MQNALVEYIGVYSDTNDLYLHIYEHLSIYLLDFIILTCLSEFSFYHYGFLIHTDLSSFKPIFVSFEIYVKLMYGVSTNVSPMGPMF